MDSTCIQTAALPTAYSCLGLITVVVTGRHNTFCSIYWDFYHVRTFLPHP